jgi:arsenite/tail-anchored protein-transporting ATPase
MRIILFTGKGGVGKTTVAAATGLLASNSGYKTLVMSTDSAHSLSDCFGIQLGNHPTGVKKNLDGLEIDVNKELKENWEGVQKQFSAVLNFQGLDEVIADEMAIFPGMDELFSLIKLKDYYDSQSYDAVIVDCAPTGETLKFLSFPEIIRWYMRNIFPLHKRMVKAARPIMKRLTDFPIPDDDFFQAAQETYQNAGIVKDFLSDDSITSVRIVLNPEKMVIKEAQRSLTYFSLFGFSVDLVIANRIIPNQVKDPYFKKWKTCQKDYLEMIEESFSPLPIVQGNLFNQEINGLTLLNQLAETIYQKKDPTQIFYKGQPVKISKDNNRYILSIEVPFLNKNDLDLWNEDQELIITAGRYRRNILLPRSLANLELMRAKYEKNSLKIEFRKGDMKDEKKGRG